MHMQALIASARRWLLSFLLPIDRADPAAPGLPPKVMADAGKNDTVLPRRTDGDDLKSSPEVLLEHRLAIQAPMPQYFRR